MCELEEIEKIYEKLNSDSDLDSSKDKGAYYNWCFTSFQKTEPVFDESRMKFLCFSSEISPTTKKEHYQGFMIFKEKMSFKGIKKNINNEWFLKKCDGSSSQNIIYCGKGRYEKKMPDGTIKIKEINPTYKEFGTVPVGKGFRTDLNNVKKQIFEGISVNEITKNDPMLYHQYGRTLEKLEDIYINENVRDSKNPTKCIWVYGGAGSGKSHCVMNNLDKKTTYLHNPSDGGFYQGYKNHKRVVINELKGEMKFSDLLQLSDKWDYNVKIKGENTRPMIAKEIIITSAKHPIDLYNGVCEEDDNINQLLRRFVIHEKKRNDGFDIEEQFLKWVAVETGQEIKSHIEKLKNDYFDYKLKKSSKDKEDFDYL